jgi:multidrug efflux pump subunit AcrA (membrane-fusion protein)
MAPQPAPESAGPNAVIPSPQSSGGRKWLLLLLLVPIAAAGLLLRPRPAKPTAASLVRTAKAVRGVLLRRVRLDGSIEARKFVNVLAPRAQAPDAGHGMVLTYLPPPGSVVQEGQMIAQIDAQAVQDHLDDVEAMVSQSEQDMRKLKAQQDAESEAIDQRVRVARGNLEKAQQDARATDAKNRIEQELLKLNVAEMQAWYDEARRQIPLLADRQQAAVRIQELTQEYQVRHRNRHQADVDHFTMKAALGGMIVMKPIYRNGEQGQVQVGDLVFPGQLFMRIVNLSEMELQTTINQAESELLKIGQRADIRFDAYPDLLMKGKVTAVGTMAASGRRVNYYIRRIAVRIALEGTDPRVIPDASASADVVVGEDADSIIVPRQAVVTEDGKPVVYVKRDGTFSPREVEIGKYSNTEASVISGLEAGEEVALERPESNL